MTPLSGVESSGGALDIDPPIEKMLGPNLWSKSMYAIIAESGRQYKVCSGDVIRIDRELGDEKTLTFDQVLLVGGGEGGAKVGAPLVAGATVTADVVRALKGPKVDIIKIKRRKGYRKHIGHRQNHLEVRITGISV